MSGPDERRGTGGGDHPLDVDAAFADIVAHFHDGEPVPPRVVDGPDGVGGSAADASLPASPARRKDDGLGVGVDPGLQDTSGDGADDKADDGADDGSDGRADGRVGEGAAGSTVDEVSDARADEAATDWAVRYEQAAREELAAHEERLAQQERKARIEAAVDRAVDAAQHRFVPDEPPPIPQLDLPGRLAWGSVLLGPLVLVLFALLWPDVASWLVGSFVTAIVAGFGYLVWRLPRNHDHDDDGDGAIV